MEDVLGSYVDPLTDEEKSRICSEMSAEKRWLVGYRGDVPACKSNNTKLLCIIS